MKRDKKSQATVFIVLAIIIILAIALAFVIKAILNREKPPTLDPAKEQVADVIEFIDGCLNKVGKEAFITLGARGGFINTSKAGLFTVPDIPTISNSLELAPGSGIIVPYWSYMKSGNSCYANCELAHKKPWLYATSGSGSVESQVKEYIDTNIGKCINNLDDFKYKFIVNITDNFSSTVRVTETNVLLTGSYPVKLKQNTFETSLKDDFQSTLDLNFRRVYEIAEDLAYAEMNSRYMPFERITKNILAAYSGNPESKMPPYAGTMEFSMAATKFWLIRDAELEFRQHLADEVPLIRVPGSGNDVLIFDDEDALLSGLYTPHQVNLPTIPQEEYDIMDIDFTYLPWWPTYMKVVPGGSAVAMPRSIKIPLINVGLQDYNFQYDVSYPVLVSIHDPDAFHFEGYTFQFALEINLRNNQPLNSNVTILEETVESTDFVQPWQRNSGNVRITTVDEQGAPLPNVNLQYSCSDETVMLGTSVMNNSRAVLNTQLPLCVNGYVGGYLKDYFVKSSVLTLAQPGKPANVTVHAEKVVTKDLRVSIKPITKVTTWWPAFHWQIAFDADTDMEPDESLIIVITRQGAPGEEEFTRYISADWLTERTATIELVSGLYSVEAVLFRELGENRTTAAIVIPEDHRSAGGFLGIGDTDYTIPEIRFNTTFYRGGVHLTPENAGNNTLFNISVDDLMQNNELVIKIIAPDFTDFEKVEDLEQMGLIEEHSKTNWTKLLPVWRSKVQP